MAKLTVFRFRFFDRARGAWIEASDLATQKAIAEVGGFVVPDSGEEVEPGLVSMSGLVIRGHAVAGGRGG